MCRRSPFNMGASRRRTPRLEQLHVLLRREGAEHVLLLLAGEPAEVELVVVAQERRPLGHGRQRRQRAQPLDHGLGVGPGQREPHARVEQEREHHVRAVVRTARVGGHVLRDVVGLDVGLAQQHGVALAPLQVLAPVVEDREVLGRRIQAWRGLLEHERRGVDAEAGGTELHPEPHDLLDLLADRGVGPVQVGLEVVEPVVVPGLRPRAARSRSRSARRGRRSPGDGRAAPASLQTYQSRYGDAGSSHAARNHGCWSLV